MPTLPIIYNGRKYYKTARGYWSSPTPRPGKVLHRAVWEDAHGPIPADHHIHHIDKDPSNNALENLTLVAGRVHTPKFHGPPPRRYGEENPFAKLTAADVLEIRAAYVKERNGGQTALAARYGVSPYCIHKIVSGKTWRHLPCIPAGPAPNCKRGHPFTPENTCLNSDGCRFCRKCHDEANRAGSERRRERRHLASIASLQALDT